MASRTSRGGMDTAGLVDAQKEDLRSCAEPPGISPVVRIHARPTRLECRKLKHRAMVR
jgi:hypothetical protein